MTEDLSTEIRKLKSIRDILWNKVRSPEGQEETERHGLATHLNDIIIVLEKARPASVPTAQEGEFRGFLKVIINDDGCTDHRWLVQTAKRLLAASVPPEEPRLDVEAMKRRCALLRQYPDHEDIDETLKMAETLIAEVERLRAAALSEVRPSQEADRARLRYLIIEATQIARVSGTFNESVFAFGLDAILDELAVVAPSLRAPREEK